MINESFLSLGRDSVRHNRLFFQQSVSAPREVLGEIIEENAAPISLHASAPKLIRAGDRTALLLGNHLFQRWLRGSNPYWYQASTSPDPAASMFLRSFLPVSDPHVSTRAASTVRGWFDIPRPEMTYVFHHIDLDQNVFTTRRETSEAAFPEFLVYSARQYGFPWRFDIERTRSANHLKPPSDAGVFIDYSIVTYPGELKLGDSREAALAVPGAAEILAQTLPLSSTTWTSTECSFVIPTGSKINERFDTLLGFYDPLPDYVSVFWRRYPVLWDQWWFVKFGHWIRAEASGYKGGLARVAFFRVRRTESQ